MKYPFTSELIQKLNKIKRDQEVREALGPYLENFKAFYFEIIESQRTLKSRTQDSGQPIKQTQQCNVPTITKRALLKQPKESFKSQSKTKHVTFSKTVKDDFTSVGYYFRGDIAPYCTKVKGKRITLGQFKSILCRKGVFRYYFKRYCNEFETRIVYEELTDDKQILPLFDGYVFAMIESIM
ncbi:axin-1 [Parasteatoda tepidariorum]|uniref:axin-1 n=1 Tax=Parasteatoda tepidariorum TaxID=114398 RepID=UPI001C71D793|nr:axin-1 [Parasteatoda tepidariorum]XP_042897700.1 axin-1 [Parasteatoda tepidariorum]